MILVQPVATVRRSCGSAGLELQSTPSRPLPLAKWDAVYDHADPAGGGTEKGAHPVIGKGFTFTL
jgi:hypothetical protein